MNLNIDNYVYQEYLERINSLPYIPVQKVTEKKGNDKLHIVYVLNHVGICGGTKVIFEHVNGLVELGVQVTILSHYNKPDWYPINAEYIKVPFQIDLAKYIPDCQIIVATYWEHISSCVEVGIAPVIYFEQGDFHLFEWDKLDEELKNVVYKQFQLPYKIIGVSEQIATIIRKNFNRQVDVFNNALNTNVFFPSKIKENSSRKYMLIVGREQTKFKGIDDLKEVYKKLISMNYDIELLWITQEEPVNRLGEVYVSPSQEEIGEIYRKASFYVCGSYYESFPLPPLEAMASGIPVITTNNIGINEYAKNNLNCLMVNSGDTDGLVKKIIEILDNKNTYNKLVEEGLKTSSEYNWTIILKKLKSYYTDISLLKLEPINQVSDWDFEFNFKDIEYHEDQNKLLNFLSQSKADIIELPVKIDAIPGISMYRWEKVIRRKIPNFNDQTRKLPLYLNKSGNLKEEFLVKEIGMYKNQEYSMAFDNLLVLINEFETGSIKHAVYVKWLSLCLYQLKRYTDAENLLNDAIITYPNYTDLKFILSLIYLELGKLNKASIIFEEISIIQEAFFFDEFIGEIDNLISVFSK